MRQFIVDQVEDETDIDIPESTQAEFANNAVVVADSLTLEPTETSNPTSSPSPLENQLEPAGEELIQD